MIVPPGYPKMTSTPSCSSASSTASPPLRGRGVTESTLIHSSRRLVVLHPRHQRAELGTDLFDLVPGALGAELLERRFAGRVLGNPFLRELAALDFGEDLLHRHPRRVVDD